MTGDTFAAGMLVWRRAVQTRHPEIAAAVAAEWDKWRQLQRHEPPDVSKPLVVILAHLSCLDDLKAQVGLAQMLAFDGIRCALILRFPNAALASIASAQARRNGWEGLVTIVDAKGAEVLVERSPGDTPLVCFQAPAVLRWELIENQLAQRHYAESFSPIASGAEADEAFLVGTAYQGRGQDYAAWRERQDGPDWVGLLGSLDVLASSEHDLGISAVPFKPSKRKAWPDAHGSLVGGAAPGDGISLQGLGQGDELIIRTAREPFHSDAIERRQARLLSAAESPSIRLPAAMLGPAPRFVRVEAHQPDGKVLSDRLLVQVRPSQLKPWMISCFLNRGGGGNPVVRAFANAIGARLAYAEDEPEVLQEVPIVWGVLRESDRILAQAKAQSLYFFYIDHAYFDRGHRRSYRITRNGYEAGPVRRCPSDRSDELGLTLRPWRKSGSEIIVCPPTDYFMEAHGCPDWLERTLEQLKGFTDRPLVVRKKPKEGERAVPLRTALKTAHALVTHSSNVAIEAACLGTPVFVAPTSAAAPVGRTELAQIEDPVYPDRDAWLAHLAYSQYSFEEIQDGRAWKMLLELEERELA